AAGGAGLEGVVDELLGLGHVVEEAVERGDVEREEPHRRLGHHRRVAGSVPDQRHLADDAARTDRGHVVVAAEHAGLALQHEEALGADVALLDEVGAGLGLHRLTELGDPVEVGVVQLGEEREVAKVVDGGADVALAERHAVPPGCGVRSAVLCGLVGLPPDAGNLALPADRHGRSSATTSAPGTGPSRRTRHGVGVASTTVEERPSKRGPATARSTPSPRAATASSAVTATGWPWRLALVVATGPTRRATACTSGWSGTRSPTGRSGWPR